MIKLGEVTRKCFFTSRKKCTLTGSVLCEKVEAATLRNRYIQMIPAGGVHIQCEEAGGAVFKVRTRREKVTRILSGSHCSEQNKQKLKW